MKPRHRIKRPERLNLVPILDSVFIFIFFLLMSAQFVEVHEIGSSVPMTQELPDKTEKDPLNLTVEVSPEAIIVRSGTRNPLERSFSHDDKEKLFAHLTDLKGRHPKENTMIVKSSPKVPFQKLINVIDNTRAPASSKDKLFEQIVFDNQGVRP